MTYKFLHDVAGVIMEIEMCETENPPVLVKDDKENVFFNFKEIPYYTLRKQVYDMLVEAKKKLPAGLHFKAFETYRPIEQQIFYWGNTTKLTREKFPNDSEEEIIRKSETYTANPYKEGSGHQTGAAIDLTLCDDNGVELDMGTKWNECNEKSATYYNGLTLAQHENRNILVSVMLGAGFTNYYEEWWHYCYGELEWAVMTRIGKTKFLKIK